MAGLTQAQVAARAGTAQTLVSLLERGGGRRTSIETWSVVAAAVGEQLVGFLEHSPGADRPRDIEHLRRQSALVDLARGGGWRALPELAIDPTAVRSRSIDVALVRTHRGEAVAAEIWTWFDDVGAALRGLDAKAAGLTIRLAAEEESPVGRWRVRSLFIVRDTRRNRALVGELRPLFAARFTGSSSACLDALSDPARAMPTADGMIWSDASGSRLRASRLGRG